MLQCITVLHHLHTKIQKVLQRAAVSFQVIQLSNVPRAASGYRVSRDDTKQHRLFFYSFS